MEKNVTYIKEEDLLYKQAEAEKQMLEEFEEGNYTFDNPLVKLNPYIISPLTAVVLFKTEKETAVTVTVRGKPQTGNTAHTFPPGKTHILPILGLYPDYENTVDLQLYQGAHKTINIKTQPLSESVPELIHMKTTEPHLKNELIIVTPAVTGAVSGFDSNGDVRWYINIPMQMELKRLKNGHLLVGTHRMVKHPYFSAGLYELDIVGKIYKEYQLPGGYHHDQFEMPNGDILVLTEDFARGTVEDMLVAIDPETGAIKKTWDFYEFISPGEGKSGKYTKEDWFHNNAVWYDEKTNSLTLSGRHIDAIVNIGFDTNKLNWIIGDPETWPEEKQKYFFKPVGENFEWQYAQHSCVISPCGDVMCFDNGTLRSKIPDKYILNKDNYSRGVRYKINTENMTIKQVWEFGKELGEAFFSQHVSNIRYYGEGHYLLHSGGQQFYDGKPAEDILPAKPDPKARRGSVTLEVVDGKVVLDLRIKGNYYRADKLALYTEGANLELGNGKKLGSLAFTEQVSAPAAKDAGESIPDSLMAHVIEESDRVALKARFELGTDAVLLLKQGDNSLHYRIDTGGSRFAANSCMPHIPPDDRNTLTYVNKNGLSGQYELFLVIDSKRYKLEVTITC